MALKRVSHVKRTWYVHCNSATATAANRSEESYQNWRQYFLTHVAQDAVEISDNIFANDDEID